MAHPVCARLVRHNSCTNPPCDRSPARTTQQQRPLVHPKNKLCNRRKRLCTAIGWSHRGLRSTALDQCKAQAERWRRRLAGVALHHLRPVCANPLRQEGWRWGLNPFPVTTFYWKWCVSRRLRVVRTRRQTGQRSQSARFDRWVDSL